MNERPLPPIRIGSYSAPVIPDVLQEHLEEVAFLSIQRRKLLFSPDITLRQFRGHDDRIAAHWEGLVLGGEASILMSLDRLEAFDPWEVFAAARVWIELGEPTAEEVAQRVEAANEDQLPAWREALARMSGERLGLLFPPGSLEGRSTKVESALAYAWGWKGVLPEEDAARLCFSADPMVRRSAARALGWGAAPGQVQRLLPALLTDPEPAVRRGALWSLCLLDPTSGVSAARRKLESETPDPFSARVLGLLGSPASVGILQTLVTHEMVGPACIRALGDLGDPHVVELLIDLLDEEEEDRAWAAREAIEGILGFVPKPPEGAGPPESAAEGEASAPESANANLEERNADEEEGPEAADGEPPQDPDDVRKAWREMEPRYQTGGRFLRGLPFPWSGSPQEEPMESIWRASLAGSGSDTTWLRKEVPDGFFADVLVIEAVAGE